MLGSYSGHLCPSFLHVGPARISPTPSHFPLLFSSVLSRDTNPNPSSLISPVAAATEGELVDPDEEAVDLIAPLIVSLWKW